jgi:hypothetical protein
MPEDQQPTISQWENMDIVMFVQDGTQTHFA